MSQIRCIGALVNSLKFSHLLRNSSNSYMDYGGYNCMGSHHRAIFVRAFALLSKIPFRAYALLSKSPFRASKSPFQLDMLFWDEVDTFCTMVSLCMSLYQYITLTLQKSLHLSLPTTQQLTPTTPKPF